MKNLINPIYVTVLFLVCSQVSFSQIKTQRKATELSLSAGFTKATKTNVDQNSCFCCGEFYSLPTPVIKGTKEIQCGTPTTFTTTACSNADNAAWYVSPAIPGATQTATAFNIPTTAAAGTYTLSYQLSCSREKFTRAEYQFTIISVPNCKPDFLVTVTQLPNGMLNISTNPIMQTIGQQHWWGIEYNGTFPNCDTQFTAIPFSDFTSGNLWGGYISNTGILTTYGGTGITIVNGYGISYSGFPNNSCFKITHYVKCCGQMIRQTAYFSVSTNNAKLTNANIPHEIKPQIIMSEVETVQ